MISWVPVQLVKHTSPMETMENNHGNGGGTEIPPGGEAPSLVRSASGNKFRRDEWSEDGVFCLLEVYESKWLLRNRAKLKGSDWEEIAEQVSIRASGTKALKTPSQCKNKIESMKKRYRAESAIASQPSSASSWQFFARMDNLLKGTTTSLVQPKSDNDIDLHSVPKTEGNAETEKNLQESNQNDGSNTSLPVIVANPTVNNINGGDDGRKETQDTASDVSAPRSKHIHAKMDGKGKDEAAKPYKRKEFNNEIAESIKMLAESILKIEEARLEMYKDAEKIRAEAEIKRGEMELKRTEIIAQTQLQIAKLFSKRFRGNGDTKGSSSLGVETDAPPTSDGRANNFSEYQTREANCLK